MNLISMTDRVLQIEQYLDITNKIKIELIYNYANFLKQPLKLGMFVPCDENDVPYKSYLTFSHSTDIGNFICEPYEGLFEIQANEKSKGWAYLDPERTRYYDKVYYTKAKADFEKAKERVIFEDCEYKGEDKDSLWIYFKQCSKEDNENSKYDYTVIYKNATLEYCVGLELTDSAIKKYNL